jgi:hypothetical protein
MKRLLTILICGLCLNIFEYIILLIFNLTEGFILGTIPVAIIKRAFRDTNETIAIRFILYFVIWVAGMYFLYERINIKNASLKFGVVNCGLYIAICILMSIPFPGSAEFFGRDFFFFLVIATFLSPFILLKTPIMKRLARNFSASNLHIENISKR